MQFFGQGLRVLVGNMTGGVGLPEFAGQIIELLRMRGVDRASRACALMNTLWPFHRGHALRQAKREDPIPEQYLPDSFRF